MTEVYRNAFQEVYVILNNTENDVYLKIPKEIHNLIKEQRNVNHTFNFINDFDSLKDSLLPETKAILFVFLMDYLSTPEQRAGIIKLQERETIRKDYEKSTRYNIDIFEENNKSLSNQNIEDINKNKELIKYGNSLFRKILNKIICFFRK